MYNLMLFPNSYDRLVSCFLVAKKYVTFQAARETYKIGEMDR